MNEKEIELIDGFFNKGWCCDLDEVYKAVMKLQYNWNELKKWLEEEHKSNISWYGSLTHHDKQYYLCKFGATKNVLDYVQDKMQELENGKDDN